MPGAVTAWFIFRMHQWKSQAAFYFIQSGVSRCVPVNWKGDGEEFFVISADSLSGGLFDKYGELSVKFPNDGHPSSCYHVADLTW